MQDWRADKRSHLHSTMYLFQLCVWCRLFVLMIDLHSTMYLFQLACDFIISMRCSIYIPLCIYFNLAFQPTVLLCSRFTFHYVSISTLWDLYVVMLQTDLHSTMYLFQLSRKLFVDFLPLFTFHYVSISTLSFPESTDAVKHLHSTMYLFQHGNYWHLRSTCF